LPALRELAFGDQLHSTSVFESLEPLAGFDGLQSLDLTPSGSTMAGLSRLAS